jgi:hypothetical protein
VNFCFAPQQHIFSFFDSLLNHHHHQQQDTKKAREMENIVCFKCGEKGHPARMCRADVPAPKQRCIVCLSDTHDDARKCPLSLGPKPVPRPAAQAGAAVLAAAEKD